MVRMQWFSQNEEIQDRYFDRLDSRGNTKLYAEIKVQLSRRMSPCFFTDAYLLALYRCKTSSWCTFESSSSLHLHLPRFFFWHYWVIPYLVLPYFFLVYLILWWWMPTTGLLRNNSRCLWEHDVSCDALVWLDRSRYPFCIHNVFSLAGYSAKTYTNKILSQKKSQGICTDGNKLLRLM